MRSRITGVHKLGVVVIASSVALVAAPVATAQAASGPSGITASGAFLLDSTKNKMLWGKNADTKRQMASTTKIMTAITVLETPKVNLKKQVTIKKEYRDYTVREGGSSARLRIGDKLTVGQLIEGLMLESGCDAAMALADTFGTGKTVNARTKSFIAKMNAKADKLNLGKTNYDSFDGISPGGKNYTTPRELAKLTRHAMKNKTFAGVVKKKTSSQKAVNNSYVYKWKNTNQLLGTYKGAVGVKTGTGTAAGPCLVFAATRNGRTVIGVVLNDKNRYPDAAKMLDWSFKTKTASTADAKLRQLSSVPQKD